MARSNGNTSRKARRPQAQKPRHHEPMDQVNQQHVRALYLATVR